MTGALVASLGMYDFDWTARADDALWSALAGRLRRVGIDAPSALTRGVDLHQIWRDPRLILGQTCGYPYVAALRGQAALVATPVYAFDGCEGAFYRSFIVAGKREARRSLADFVGARAAINARDSNSGMNLFRAMIAPLARERAFFAEVIVTGSHEASLTAVMEAKADIAAIDCVTFGLLQQGRPHLTNAVEIVAQTPVSPGLPLIINAALAKSHLAAVRDALFATLQDPALAAPRRTLGLVGAAILGDSDYDSIVQIERDAVALGYRELA